MNYILKLNQIRQVLGLEIKLASVKLQDGSTLEYEVLEAGYPVMLISADGTSSPAPAGTYATADGDTITVDENSIISEVIDADEAPEADHTEVEISGKKEEAKAEPNPAEAKETTPDAETPADQKSEEMKAIHERMDATEEAMSAAFAAIQDIAKEVADVKEKMNAIHTKMEKFSKAPAATKIPKVSEAFTVTDDINALDAKLDVLKNLRNK